MLKLSRHLTTVTYSEWEHLHMMSSKFQTRKIWVYSLETFKFFMHFVVIHVTQIWSLEILTSYGWFYVKLGHFTLICMACGKKLPHAIQVNVKWLNFNKLYKINHKKSGFQTWDLSCVDHYKIMYEIFSRL